MKELTISQNDAGQRLDRFLAKAVPLLPASLAQKYIRIKRIKRNPDKETYRGLTYAYMERYIETHANADEIMEEYKELRLISECHCKARRYPKIKKWFLKKYPEVEKFGTDESDNEAATETGAKYEAVMAPLVKSNPADSELAIAG